MTCTNFFKGISHWDRCETFAVTNSLAVALSEGLDDDDLEALGNLVQAVGSMIVLYGSVGLPCNSEGSDDQSDD